MLRPVPALHPAFVVSPVVIICATVVGKHADGDSWLKATLLVGLSALCGVIIGAASSRGVRPSLVRPAPRGAVIALDRRRVAHPVVFGQFILGAFVTAALWPVPLATMCATWVCVADRRRRNAEAELGTPLLTGGFLQLELFVAASRRAVNESAV